MAVVTRVLSPGDWKKRQIDTLKSVGEGNYALGISKPKADPIEKGKAAEPKFADAMKKAIDAEARKKGLEKTSMGEWYGLASTLGKGRLVEGVTKREAKVATFLNTFQPMLVDLLGKIDVMADVTDKDREDRVLANLRGLKALKGKA